ncbi:hypothetical protein CDD80_4135 [Ophiocordyceps camponoti-rufipedis]|uniref:SMP-30/Gluconolactonase/LRE-like region domain-containing protein n=1 Tax=Ophiocordyceps camponoti-rufipedis TaxID=2004952 RepID=A0A2C5ZIK7_9HYPO|nr:hypothetical protein CDD80_4135 [Ophiocordyceps camponoti-rufipedis]
MLRLPLLAWILSTAVNGQYAPPPYRQQDGSHPPSGLPTRIVQQLPPSTWIENMAVRSNGNLILTQLRPSAAVIQVTDPSSPYSYYEVAGIFPSIDGLYGITEVSTDVFVVVGCRFATIGDNVKGSAETWMVNFKSTDRSGGPLVKRVGRHPYMEFPNGMTSLPGVDDVVLIADSTLGLVWRLYLETGVTEVAIQLREMAYHQGTRLKIGINGIKIIDGYLWWSNSYVGDLYRLRIDRLGNPERNARPEHMFRHEGRFIDDFVLDDRGLWGTTNQNNTVLFAAYGGRVSDVAGEQNGLDLAVDTSCAFGRGERDGRILYVATGNNPKKGLGGKVVAVDTTSIRPRGNYFA